jgi:hypothetical protein
MKINPLALAPVALLITALPLAAKKPKEEPAPPARAIPSPLPTERIDAYGFPALLVKARKSVGEFLPELKALGEWAAAKKIAGTPFFYVYDGPCDGGPMRWVSDAGLMLDAPPAAGFDLGPYEYRLMTAPSPRMVHVISGATSIGGETAPPFSAPGAPAAGSLVTDPADPRSGVRHACRMIADSEKEYYKMKPEQHFLPPAMIFIVLHGMKRFTLDEPVTLELRVPHYDLDASGRMPGPVMPTPIVEAPKPPESAPAVSAPVKKAGTKTAKKTAASAPASGASAPMAHPPRKDNQ